MPRWNDEEWRVALKQTVKKWIPFLQPSAECGFCTLVLEKHPNVNNWELRPKKDACRKYCPVVILCSTLLTKYGRFTISSMKKQEKKVQEFLTKECKRHNVRIPKC